MTPLTTRMKSKSSAAEALWIDSSCEHVALLQLALLCGSHEALRLSL